jgi:hypothetical protein
MRLPTLFSPATKLLSYSYSLACLNCRSDFGWLLIGQGSKRTHYDDVVGMIERN